MILPIAKKIIPIVRAILIINLFLVKFKAFKMRINQVHDIYKYKFYHYINVQYNLLVDSFQLVFRCWARIEFPFRVVVVNTFIVIGGTDRLIKTFHLKRFPYVKKHLYLRGESKGEIILSIN